MTMTILPFFILLKKTLLFIHLCA